MMKILDCTLRDGGYYTNWDFPRSLVTDYLKTMEKLPIDIIEIGYRNPCVNGYYGEYFFLPEDTLRFCRENFSKQIAIMLNAKDVQVSDLQTLLVPCQPYVDIVRLATAPDKIVHSIGLAKVIKSMGFEVSLNIMYLSKWGKCVDSEVFSALDVIPDSTIDYLCLVDSYGSVFPSELETIMSNVGSVMTGMIGFHGHNNLELAFANSLEAVAHGCSMIDCTVMGMGRGAGNLKTELLLTYLSRCKLDISFFDLTPLVEKFEHLQKIHEWGTNIPYMISGVNSLPQKDIMSWMSLRRYSVMQIVQKLIGQRCAGGNSRSSLQSWSVVDKPALIVGGGDSVVVHRDAICRFIAKNDVLVIFSSAKHIHLFRQCTDRDRILCLVGSEGKRVEANADSVLPADILLANPNIETYYPPEYINRTFLLTTDSQEDSPLFIALSATENVTAYLVGFDGYSVGNKNALQLMQENQDIIDQCAKQHHLVSLLPTQYKNVDLESIYSKI